MYVKLTADLVISLMAGVAFSPHAANFVRPLDYAGSEENLNAIVSRPGRFIHPHPLDDHRIGNDWFTHLTIHFIRLIVYGASTIHIADANSTRRRPCISLAWFLECNLSLPESSYRVAT